MAENFEFNVELRKTGKHNSRRLRREGHVPAVVYGPSLKNVSLYVSEKEVVRFAKQQYENTIFVFKSADKSLNNLKVLKKATTLHPVSRRPVHLDFFAIDLNKAIRVSVEVRYEGRAAGVKDGGILNTVRRDVEVECLPAQIPQFLAIDVTPLGIGNSLHVSDLQMPEGIRLITLPTETLCTVTMVEEIVAEVAPAAAATAEGAAAGAAAGAAGAAGAAAGAAGAAGATPAAGADAKKSGADAKKAEAGGKDAKK